MKIAFLSTVLHYPWGGADVWWTDAAEAAVARGDQVLLSISPLTAAHPRMVALFAQGAVLFARRAPELQRGFWPRALRKIRRRLAVRDPLVARLAAFAPDLVVLSLGGTYDLIAYRPLTEWLIRTGTRFQVIANFQLEHPALGAADLAYTRRVFAHAAGVNFNSSRNLAVTRRHLLDPLPNARVFQYRLRWQPGDAVPWPAASPARLAAVARLEPVKGLPLLLHALAEAAPALPPWQLRLYGRGDDEGYLRATVQHLGLQDRVVFRGFVGDLRAIWAENHLLCSPALEEGVPMTIPEAMLLNRPVLATDVGGTSDWLRDGETGFVCPAPSVPLLAATLRRAFAQSAQWEAMGLAAGRAAQARYRADDHLALLA